MAAETLSATRRRTAWCLAVAGLVLYNWWIAVPLRPSLLISPNELFSNLEVTGQPYASWMQHADCASGLLLFAALIIVGWRSLDGGALEWLLLSVFALGGAAGGIFPEQCLDTINRSCHLDEIELRLAGAQYFHIVAGIVEFAAITAVLYLSYRRTRGEPSRIATLYRSLYVGAWVFYPLLGVAYLFVLGGSFVEAAFFTGFSLIVIAQLEERTAHGPRRLGAPGESPLSLEAPDGLADRA
jgi:hypothetical protein